MRKTIKDILTYCLFIGAIVAVLCLISCRDDPLIENIYRVVGAMLSTLIFIAIPFVGVILIWLITFPLRLFDKKKKTRKKR